MHVECVHAVCLLFAHRCVCVQVCAGNACTHAAYVVCALIHTVSILHGCCVHVCAACMHVPVRVHVHFMHACCVCTACEHAWVQWRLGVYGTCVHQDVPRGGCLGESGVYVRAQIGI